MNKPNKPITREEELRQLFEDSWAELLLANPKNTVTTLANLKEKFRVIQEKMDAEDIVKAEKQRTNRVGHKP